MTRTNRDMLRWSTHFVLCGLLVLSGFACAKPVPPEPLPVHPFARWVHELESGATSLDQVRARFGEPNEIEQGPRRERIWRYVFREITWPDDDPMRPVVAADGTIRNREPSSFDHFADRADRVFDWIDKAMFFPPRQDRPPRTRPLPATVHHLEVVFGFEGTLRRYRYSPRAGTASVPVID